MAPAPAPLVEKPAESSQKSVVGGGTLVALIGAEARHADDITA
jgi:hypothetical protein